MNKVFDITDASVLDLFGLRFEFDGKVARYKLIKRDRDYDAVELIIITEEVLRFINSINRRGLQN
jgi:hypothetical protein